LIPSLPIASFIGDQIMATKSSKKTASKPASKTALKSEIKSRFRLPEGVVNLQKRSIERQRSAFDTTFQAVQSFQEGRESAIHNLLESSSFVPKEWRLMADAWIETARQSREGFREAVDTSYSLAEKFVARLGDGATAKA
jgi:hypothetical protein